MIVSAARLHGRASSHAGVYRRGGRNDNELQNLELQGLELQDWRAQSAARWSLFRFDGIEAGLFFLF
jgi:hypothetical protein